MEGLSNGDGSATHANGKSPKKQMLLNAFDMSITVFQEIPQRHELIRIQELDIFHPGNGKVPTISPQPKPAWTTGSTKPRSWSAATSTHCFWQTNMADTTPTKATSTTASEGQLNGR